jgi:hypothetical protein
MVYPFISTQTASQKEVRRQWTIRTRFANSAECPKRRLLVGTSVNMGKLHDLYQHGSTPGQFVPMKMGGGR